MGKWLAVVVAVLLGAVLGGCAFVNVPLASPPQPLEEQLLEGDGAGKILRFDETSNQVFRTYAETNASLMYAMVHNSAGRPRLLMRRRPGCRA